MDYKEKYEQALEKATIYHKQGNEDMKLMMETCFPELHESEDEKIRKWIIEDIRFNMNNEPLNNSEYRKKAEKAIAWLEKQDKKKLVWNKVDECMFEEICKNRNLSLAEQIWLKSLKEK